MKVLVATAETQGQRSDDFYWAEEGELVIPGFECDRDQDVDVTVEGASGCGCRLSMTGAASHKATTTFKVIEADLTRGEMEAKLLATLASSGWLDLAESTAEGEAWVRDLLDEIIEVAEDYPVGTVLERRGDVYQAR